MASSDKRRRQQQANDAVFAEFLDLAGHDLRLPITALKGQIQLMQRRLSRRADRESELNDLGKMLYQIERLNHGLEVFLEEARFQQKRLELFLVECDLVAVAQRIVGIYAAGCPGYDIRLETELDALPGIYDRMRVELLLSIFLSNAVKYSPGGEVLVRIAPHAIGARFEVSDQGIGVPSAERFRIFEAYQHGSNVENAGIGLGLHLAREITRMHRGRIGVRARRGGGSTFWFALSSANATSIDAAANAQADGASTALFASPQGDLGVPDGKESKRRLSHV